MVEVCQALDGRIAVRIPAPIDDMQKGVCSWLAVSFIGEPQNYLHVELLTDDDVCGWTQLTPPLTCANPVITSDRNASL